MLVPLSWLKEYVNLPPLEKLVNRLNQTGTTVASVKSFGEGLEGVIVGEILEVTPHPNADKLQLAEIAVPGKKLSIVCGAKNIAAGQKVPVAPVGSSVPVGPNGVPMKIERVKIRDVESQGMLASAKELGLGDDHTGILILDPSVKVGTKLTSVLNLPEVVLETEVTTNRGDELSIYGLAREISAVTDTQLKPLQLKPAKLESKEPRAISVKVEDTNLCPRYSAAVLTDIKIGPSPAFIQARLRQAGMRPISNIVDITNYVMLLTGQPLHAFDYNKVTKGSITVRESRAGERTTTLDGMTRQLGFGSVVIADQEKILAIGGVMGGETSGVTNLTDTIVLESAVFNPVSIRQTVMKHNLRSEASHRFERGVDIEGTVNALNLATDLLKKYTDAKVGSEVVDVYSKTYQPAKVSLTKPKLDQYLGVSYPLSSAETILGKLGFKKVSKTTNQITVSVPSWRSQDVSIEEDLIEEVARVEGYDKVPSVLPVGEIPILPPQEEVSQMHVIREHLSSLGLNEIINYPMVSEAITGEEKALKIANSISKEWEYLRLSLIPGLAQASNLNLNFGSDPWIFELGKIYQPKEGDLPYEKFSLALVGEDFATVKGYFESLLVRLGISEAGYETCESDFFTPGSAAAVYLGDTIVGQVGPLSPTWRSKTGLKRSLYLAEFDVASILEEVPPTKTFQAVAKFPQVKEDLSILVDVKTPIAQVLDAVKAAGGELLSEVEPFDIFVDPKLGENKKSVSLTLSFQSREKTLTDSEVKEERTRIEQALKEKLKAKIR